ncbi:short-chain dehydrogenase [Croceibacterium mercuriale]|uniref:Short-chain dehydrogenase n=1 Tax=Croceibacterium mercuriale TaxID=1572751 RepID=A0A0B2BSB5_9SPHN|nr:SDR family oxidoreductase [Croceibacterium mercuriale]KHL24284.1 short-chain dehydrogenase [Croceibacterium mercuriale]
MSSKVWFVTGANSGIGASVVKAALASGDSVVATGRSMDKLRSAFADAENERLALVQLDVTDRQQADRAIDEAVARFGRIDVLVNNAGNAVLGNFEDFTAADFEKQLAPNLYGVINLMQAALPVMRKQRRGHIINISSVAGGTGQNQTSAYSAAKFAVEGLSMSVAQEVEKFGIHLTIVEPGFFRTRLLDQGSVSYVETRIEDYAGASARDTWSQYDGAQPGDPDKLGQALVTIAAMDKPLKLFLAGSDAIAVLTPVVEERLKAIKDNEALSRSTDNAL